jgi:hypothetical protein
MPLDWFIMGYLFYIDKYSDKYEWFTIYTKLYLSNIIYQIDGKEMYGKEKKSKNLYSMHIYYVRRRVYYLYT